MANSQVYNYKKSYTTYLQGEERREPAEGIGYIIMLRARIFRSLIIRTWIKERNIRARNITYI